jgi:hypothetical protein
MSVHPDELRARAKENVNRIHEALQEKSEAPLVKWSDQPITPKELLFIHYVISGVAVTTAAERAGYTSRGTGTDLIKQPRIQKEIEKRRAALERVASITREGLMAELMCMMYELGDSRNDMIIKIKIIETMAKMKDFFAPLPPTPAQQVDAIRIEIVTPEVSDVTDGNDS